MDENDGRTPARKKRAPARPARRAQASQDASSGAQTHPAVIAFLRDLDHPLKDVVEAVRQIILGVSPEIREEIKWKAPSFRTVEHFATFHLRDEDRVRLILHLGAKVKAAATQGMSIADPEGLLEWQARDRCLVTFRGVDDVQARRSALEAVLRAWIEQLRSS